MEANTAKYLRRPLTQLRRKDRSLDDEEWVDRMLTTAAMGHVSVVLDGQPLLTSNLFWFDGGRVYMHSAQVGKFRAAIDGGASRACFTVAEHGRILPARTPFDFSTEYASVVAYGTIRVVAGPDEKRRALDGLMAKYAPHLQAGIDYEPMPDADVALTSVFCLDVESRVGKHNVKPAEYPAYVYQGGSFIDAEREAGRTTMQPKELA